MTQIKPTAGESLTTSRADTQVTKQPKKLFKYYMDRNIADEKQQLNFFNRINRWRYNTVNRQHASKWYRIKYPAMGAFAFILAIDWIYGWDRTEPVGH